MHQTIRIKNIPFLGWGLDPGMGVAGEAGALGMTSGFVGVSTLCSVSLFVGGSIFWIVSVLGGLATPSGSFLVGLVSRAG